MIKEKKLVNILLKSGFKEIECIKDLSGNDRVIKGTLWNKTL